MVFQHNFTLGPRSKHVSITLNQLSIATASHLNHRWTSGFSYNSLVRIKFIILEMFLKSKEQKKTHQSEL